VQAAIRLAFCFLLKLPASFFFFQQGIVLALFQFILELELAATEKVV
jgi:hypothetical protein